GQLEDVDVAASRSVDAHRLDLIRDAVLARGAVGDTHGGCALTEHLRARTYDDVRKRLRILDLRIGEDVVVAHAGPYVTARQEQVGVANRIDDVEDAEISRPHLLRIGEHVDLPGLSATDDR